MNLNAILPMFTYKLLFTKMYLVLRHRKEEEEDVKRSVDIKNSRRCELITNGPFLPRKHGNTCFKNVRHVRKHKAHPTAAVSCAAAEYNFHERYNFKMDPNDGSGGGGYVLLGCALPWQRLSKVYNGEKVR